MRSPRAGDWLRQAQDDQRWGGNSLRAGHFSQTCFIAQQVAEKSVKAMAFHRGAEAVRGHSILAIVRELGIDGELEEAAKRLDQYYIASRYPDAQPGGAPFELFTRGQAEEALRLSAAFLEAATREVADGPGD